LASCVSATFHLEEAMLMRFPSGNDELSEVFVGRAGWNKERKWDKIIGKHWNRFECCAIPLIPNRLI
jgi:hypothetical protein